MAYRPKLNVTAAMAVAAAQAVRLLQDPETRAQLVQVGNTASKRLKAWYLARSASDFKEEVDDVIDEDGRRVGVAASISSARLRRPSALFTHERLERRTVKLAAALDELRGAVPNGSSIALDGVDEAIMRIHVALRVASNLPLTKRARAHHEIASALSQLERAVMEAVLRDDAVR